MSTRLYFDGFPVAVISNFPAMDAGWTTPKPTGSNVGAIVTSRAGISGDAAEDSCRKNTSTSGETVGDQQFIGPPMVEQTISGTLKAHAPEAAARMREKLDEFIRQYALGKRHGGRH